MPLILSHEALEKIGWDLWDHDTLSERLDDFRDIRLFLSKYGPHPEEQENKKEREQCSA